LRVGQAGQKARCAGSRPGRQYLAPGVCGPVPYIMGYYVGFFNAGQTTGGEARQAGRKRIALMALAFAVAAILAAPPRNGAVPGALTLPFLTGVSFAPLWGVRSVQTVRELAWDWLAWEILMASVLALGTLATVEVSRVHMAHWPRRPGRATDHAIHAIDPAEPTDATARAGSPEPSSAGQSVGGVATAS
jgi:hypothetical protein